MIEVPKGWADAVARIGASSWRRLAVLGERDQGKSTFCRVLLERHEPGGTGAWLLDADVGQKMIGPPACVTRAKLGADALQNIGDGAHRASTVHQQNVALRAPLRQSPLQPVFFEVWLLGFLCRLYPHFAMHVEKWLE